MTPNPTDPNARMKFRRFFTVQEVRKACVSGNYYLSHVGRPDADNQIMRGRLLGIGERLYIGPLSIGGAIERHGEIWLAGPLPEIHRKEDREE